MKIVLDSNKVLVSIYNLLNENSYTLYIEFNMENLAKEVNMTKEHLNLCIHYLIDSGYIQGDYAYDKNTDIKKKVMITSMAIKEIEKNYL